jgi:hypothetical protein
MPYLAVVERPTFVSRRDYKPVRQQSVANSTAESREADAFKARMATVFTCFRCNLNYREGDNYIARECSIHIGPKKYNSRLIPSYVCCSGTTEGRGCVSCMHVSNETSAKYLEKNMDRAVVQLPKRLIDRGVVDVSMAMVDNPSGDRSARKELRGSPELYYTFHMMAL